MSLKIKPSIRGCDLSSKLKLLILATLLTACGGIDNIPCYVDGMALQAL
jgi:hypothetical protein